MKIRVPYAFRELFNPARYKAYYGGRGSAKSESFARALVAEAFHTHQRVICAREIQRSIKDSVKLTLDDVIDDAGLRPYFESTSAEIRGPNDSLFLFAGTRTNPDTIKSTKGITRLWVEEADRLSQRSLDLLRPTLRQQNSELWFSWNPRNANDPVDRFFRGEGAQFDGETAIIREVSWRDNPFFPEVLRAEMERDRRRDPELYAHVWEGAYEMRSDARVFRNWRVDEVPAPPDGTVLRFGADWGFSVDPSVLVRCWIDGRTLYIDREAYQVGCEIDHLPALFAGDAPNQEWQNPKRWTGIEDARRWPITADSARPETISYLNKRGFNVKPARKGSGSVEEGIQFLQSFDIVVSPECRHVAQELTYYRYKVDPHTEEVLPILEDKDNHTIDAIRYALEGLRRSPSTVIMPGSVTQESPLI